MGEKHIDPAHTGDIAETFTKLIRQSDDNRIDFLKLLLAIYTPVTSGIFFLSTSIKLISQNEKHLFVSVATSSALIVLSSLVVQLVYFLSAEERAKKYVDHIKETGKHFNKPLYGKKWHSKIIRSFTMLAAGLLLLNIVSVLGFIYTTI